MHGQVLFTLQFLTISSKHIMKL